MGKHGLPQVGKGEIRCVGGGGNNPPPPPLLDGARSKIQEPVECHS